VQAYYAPVDVEELLAQLFEQSYERKEPAEEKVTLDVAS
jgi:hypothetical protein